MALGGQTRQKPFGRPTEMVTKCASEPKIKLLF